MQECSRWLDREDHAVMENDHAYIGVSEYCGLASIWFVCKADYEDVDYIGLTMAWCGKACNKFTETFGDLTKVATFSNGESVYQRIGG